MGCTSAVMKCFLNVLNSLMALFGAILIALAVVSLKSAPQAYIYFLFIIGGITLVTALLGCCGICHEHICMTTTYAILLGLLFVSEIIGKIYVTDSEAIRKFAREDVEKTWLEEIRYPGAMNNTQQTYECCGKIAYTDYRALARPIPLSCYPEMRVNVTALFNTGCISAAETKFTELFNYSSSGEWSNLVLTGIMFLFSIYLVIRFRNKQNRYHY